MEGQAVQAEEKEHRAWRQTALAGFQPAPQAAKMAALPVQALRPVRYGTGKNACRYHKHINKSNDVQYCLGKFISNLIIN